jgi:hypothetical protein
VLHTYVMFRSIGDKKLVLQRSLSMIVIVMLGWPFWISLVGCAAKENDQETRNEGASNRSDGMKLPTHRKEEAQSFTLRELPDIGDMLQHLPEPHFTVLVNSASLAPAYEIHWNGNAYNVAVSKTTGMVLFVSTKAKGFRTPEGFSVDNTIGDLLTKYPNGKRKEPGWGSYVVLPSGWAAFAGTEGELDANSRIESFFRRGVGNKR